jgi:hypothetical protein
MRWAPASSAPLFRGTRARRGGRTVRGKSLVRSGLWRPPAWALALAGLAALVIALVILFPGGSTPGTPGVPQVAIPKPQVPAVSGPSLGGGSLPGVSTPGISAPQLSTPSLGVPHIVSPEISAPGFSTPSISGPGISTPNIGTPHVGGRDLSLEGPSAPHLHGPSFHISFGWLFDFFSICWHLFIFFVLIPWWVILLAILLGRGLWLLWKERKKSDEDDPRAPA